MRQKTLNKKEYKNLLTQLEDLKKICSGITAGSKELREKLITDLKERLKDLFLFVRLMITRDFKSSTGMSFDKWTEFADKICKHFEDISNVVERLYDCHSKGEFDKTTEIIDELEQVAKPFLQDYEDTIKSLGKLQKWLAEIPNTVKSVPPGFMSAEDKRTAIEESPKAAADLQKFVKALSEAKMKILTIKNFKK